MWRNQLLHHLADYASVLGDCLGSCARPEDRQAFLRALAFVGILLGKINDEEPYAELRECIDAEDRKFGWNLLSRDDGKVAEVAWTNFRDAFNELFEQERALKRR